MVGLSPDVSKMNRAQRRRHMRQLGYTWRQARALAAQQARDRDAEAKIAAKASRLTPEQARQALAQWAERGGK